jgi:hypothetical protein
VPILRAFRDLPRHEELPQNTSMRFRSLAVCTLFAVSMASATAQGPGDISGLYSFLHQGESLQLGVQGDKVSGIVTRIGESDFDQGVVLDHFITSGSLHGKQLTFATAEIHAVRFEFSGRVERGPGKTRAEEGFYVLKGVLKRYHGDAEHRVSAESREVEFKSQAEQ